MYPMILGILPAMKRKTSISLALVVNVHDDMKRGHKMIASDTVLVPFVIASGLPIVGGTAHALRLLLVADNLRAHGETSVILSQADMLAAVGGTLVSLKKAVANLSALRVPHRDGAFCPVLNETDREPEAEDASWSDEDETDAYVYDDEDEDAPHPVLASTRPEPRMTYLATRHRRIEPDGRRASTVTPGSVTLSFSDRWLALPRDQLVPIPARELRALTTRCGIVLRLRAAVWLASEPGPHRIHVPLTHMLHYAGTDDVATPAVYWRSYLEPGLADLDKACPSVAIVPKVVRSGNRIQALNLAVRRRQRRSRVKVAEASAVSA